MKSDCSATAEFERSEMDGASHTNTGQLSKQGYFHRVSQTIEHGILAFVVLATMLGAYANHSYLMSDILIL